MAGDKRGHVALCSQGPASAVTSLQLIFALVPSCNYTFGSQKEKKRGEKKSRTSCASFALGTHPHRADRCLFQPIIPPSTTLLPRLLCTWGTFLCLELTNSSHCLSSHQPQHPNSCHEEGAGSLFQGSWTEFSCLSQLLGFPKGSG